MQEAPEKISIIKIFGPLGLQVLVSEHIYKGMNDEIPRPKYQSTIKTIPTPALDLSRGPDSMTQSRTSLRISLGRAVRRQTLL